MLYDSNNVKRAVEVHKALQYIAENGAGDSGKLDEAVETVKGLGKQFDGHRFTRMERFRFWAKTGTFLSRDFNKAAKFGGVNPTLQVARRAIFGEQTAQDVTEALKQLKGQPLERNGTVGEFMGRVAATERETGEVTLVLPVSIAKRLDVDSASWYSAHKPESRDKIVTYFAKNRKPAEFKDLLAFLRSTQGADGKVLISDDEVIEFARNRLSNQEIADLLATEVTAKLNPPVEGAKVGMLVDLQQTDDAVTQKPANAVVQPANSVKPFTLAFDRKNLAAEYKQKRGEIPKKLEDHAYLKDVSPNLAGFYLEMVAHRELKEKGTEQSPEFKRQLNAMAAHFKNNRSHEDFRDFLITMRVNGTGDNPPSRDSTGKLNVRPYINDQEMEVFRDDLTYDEYARLLATRPNFT